MNISEKLALMFIKKHFHYFDTEVESGVILRSTEISKCDTLTNGVKIFKYRGRELCVYLPEILSPESSSKKSMISKVQRNDISLEDINKIYDWCWYRVTQNRLNVLEEIMYNSGMTDAGVLYRFNNRDIVKTDSDNSEICTSAQDYLTMLNGFKQDDTAYFYASDVQMLCKNIDILYSKKLRQKDKLLCTVDPRFIECNSKVIELTMSTFSSALGTLNTLLDKLVTALKQK